MIKNRIIKKGSIIEIVPNGKFNYKRILIDAEDLPKLGNATIFVNDKGYALFKYKNKTLRVHNVVMGVTPDGIHVVDHINNNRLDNRKKNLRWIAIRSNNRNKGSYVRNTTGVIGISEQNNYSGHYYLATLTDPNSKLDKTGQGKRYSKRFNIRILGKAKAFKMAQDWLKKMKKQLKYDQYKSVPVLNNFNSKTK